MLRDAVEVLVARADGDSVCGGDQIKVTQVYWRDREWIMDPVRSEQAAMSFDDCCSMVGIAPEALRELLRRAKL